MLEGSHPRSLRGVSGGDPEGGVRKWRPAAAARNRWPREARDPRPPGTTTWLRGARRTDPEGKCPPLHDGGRRRRRKRGPEAQNRHGGAPRGERPALWDARRLARRLAYRVISAFTRVCDAHDTPHGCPLAPERLSALRPPLDSG